MNKKQLCFVILIFIAVMTAWAITPKVTANVSSDPGEFGDQFGSINALFSGLAFLGIVIALILQQKELTLSTKELRDSAKALARQVEISAATARLQVLPILIENQKGVISTYGGKYLNDIARQDHSIEYVSDKIKEINAFFATCDQQLNFLREKFSTTPSLYDETYNEDPARDPIAKEIRVMISKRESYERSINHLCRLLAFKKEIDDIYSWMSKFEYKSDEILKEHP